MDLKYKIDDKPGIGATLLYGAQWLMICIPVVLTSTFVAPEGEMVFFTQKLFALCGLAMIVQVLFGHKMPLVTGPAAVLLMGVIAASEQGYEPNAIYPSMMLGGALVVLIAVSGAMKYVERIFTPRVVAAIVVLISFTMAKPIIRLMFYRGEDLLPANELVLALLMMSLGVVVMAFANKVLRGVWKSMVVIAAMIIGAIIYYSVIGFPAELKSDTVEPRLLMTDIEFDAGVVVAFIFCYIALLINQVGSVQSLGEMLGASGMPNRQKRGMIITGAANVLCGAMGVLGPVDYSLSPGVVASTSCASRYTMLPAAVAMVLLALFPQAVAMLLTIPNPVMGVVLLYLMATQVAAGLNLMQASKATVSFQDGLVLGIPIMFTVIISFMPEGVMGVIPEIVRPIVGNGFVMGIIVVMILEHIVLRAKRDKK